MSERINLSPPFVSFILGWIYSKLGLPFEGSDYHWTKLSPVSSWSCGPCHPLARGMEYDDWLGLGRVPTARGMRVSESQTDTIHTDGGRGGCCSLKKNQVAVTRIKRIYARQAETVNVSVFHLAFL